jgi:hypothetical protein
LDIVIHGGLSIFPTFAMNTKGKNNKPHKKVCRPSLDFHTLHPKKPCLESMKGVLIIDQIKGHFFISQNGPHGGMEGGQGQLLGQMGKVIIIL